MHFNGIFNIFFSYCSILFSACESNNFDLIKYALSFEGMADSTNQYDETSVFVALKSCNIELAKFLISTGKFDIKKRNSLGIIMV
ncbi:hypothetical protein M9Y10_030530 [Tritrichomonas musculus]|uniref:Ankyrin repeat protein n=1 Tax=Tritrichomonas musculus TaxID=1915356 RepID=A0ABR2H5A5_9EUKA